MEAAVGGRKLGRGHLIRLGSRALIACGVVGCLSVVAGWHASGQVRRGEIDRMLRMGATASPQIAAGSQTRGKLDRGRLKALAASAAK